MPSGEDILRGLADAASTQETLAELHDAGLSDRQIGQMYGVNKGTVWRARTGRSRAPKLGRNSGFRNAKARRELERRIRRPFNLGKVPVRYGRQPQGWREIDNIRLDDPNYDDKIAELLEAVGDGDYQHGANLLSDLIMEEYGAGDSAGGYIEIEDYENGIDWD